MICLIRVLLFFFFKQKTAYEMRISDRSSDVCSSDLAGLRAPACPAGGIGGALAPAPYASAFANMGAFRSTNMLNRRGARAALMMATSTMAALVAVSSTTIRVAMSDAATLRLRREIGRAAGRERVCQ